MASPKKADPARVQMKLPPDLKAWAVEYADRKNTNLTQMFKDHLTQLREKEDGRRRRS